MPRLDDCHPQVVRALEKEGWITTTSYGLFIHKRRAFVDIGATRQINGTREQILLVEVKCFTDRNSTTDELYGAIGQYLIYCTMMVELGMVAPLYLAIPQTVFVPLFDRIVKKTVEDYQIKVVIIDLEIEEVVRWIE